VGGIWRKRKILNEEKNRGNEKEGKEGKEQLGVL
jgi:hypothetical protein